MKVYGMLEKNQRNIKGTDVSSKRKSAEKTLLSSSKTVKMG